MSVTYHRARETSLSFRKCFVLPWRAHIHASSSASSESRNAFVAHAVAERFLWKCAVDVGVFA